MRRDAMHQDDKPPLVFQPYPQHAEEAAFLGECIGFQIQEVGNEEQDSQAQS